MRIKGGCTAIASLIVDESGQDIVEYALLTALIGVASILTWQVIADKVGVAYDQTETEMQALAPPLDPIVPE